MPAGEGDRDPAQEAGAAVAEAARHAAELSQAGPVTDALGRGENRSRPGIRIREDRTARSPPSGDAPDVHFPTRQGQVTGSATARRALSAAHESGGGGSGAAVGSLHAVGAGRSGLQVSEERPGPSADLPPVGTSRRGAYPDRVPGVLLDGDAEIPSANTCSWIEPESGTGETRGDPGARRLPADNRWAPSGDASLHRAGRGRGAAAAPTPARAPPTTAAAPRQRSDRRHASTQNVVQTLANRPLKTNGFPAEYAPKCESWAKECPSATRGSAAGVRLRLSPTKFRSLPPGPSGDRTARP